MNAAAQHAANSYDNPSIRLKKITVLPEDIRPICPLRKDGALKEASLRSSSWRTRIHNLFDNDSVKLSTWESTVGTLINGCLFFFIALSCVVFTVDTLPQFYLLPSEPAQSANHVIYTLEATSVAVFSFELLIRFVTAPNPYEFLLSPLTLIDLVSILPFYIDIIVEAIAPGSQAAAGVSFLITLRLLRLVRVLRVFKLSRHSHTLQMASIAFLDSRSALALLVFLIVVATVIFSSLVFYAEQSDSYFYVGPAPPPRKLSFTNSSSLSVVDGTATSSPLSIDDIFSGTNPTTAANGSVFARSLLQLEPSSPSSTPECCPCDNNATAGSMQATREWRRSATNATSAFQSIPATFWWAVVTVTTVGYGDNVPQTWLGKLIASTLMVCGILVIALPTILIGSSLSRKQHAQAAAESADADIPLEVAVEMLHGGQPRADGKNVDRHVRLVTLIQQHAIVRQIQVLRGVRDLQHFSLALDRRLLAIQKGLVELRTLVSDAPHPSSPHMNTFLTSVNHLQRDISAIFEHLAEKEFQSEREKAAASLAEEHRRWSKVSAGS